MVKLLKIKGEFESCTNAPEYIEIAFSDKKNALIKLENLSIDGNLFSDDEAYFLEDLQVSDTEFLYTNFDKIIDDFENDVFFKKLIAEDEAGKVIITIDENEDTPGEKIYSITAEWFSERSVSKSENNIIKNPNESEINRPDLNSLELFSFEEIENFNKSISIEEYAKYDQSLIKNQQLER